MAAQANDDDWIEHLLVASTHDYLLFFTTVGKVYRLKVHELPEAQRQARGRALVNLLPMREGEKVCTIIAHARLLRGRVPRPGDAQRRRQEDALPRVRHAAARRRHHRDQHPRGRRAGRARASRAASDDILLVSRMGQAVRFAESRGARDGPRDERRAPA